MQNTLISIGIAIIAAFVAALAGPYFVDWSHFRGKFETELSTLLGAPVAIGGTIRVELLPSPQFVFADIAHVAPPDGTQLRIGAIHLGLSLPDLLRGEVRATQASFDAPEVQIVRADDGQWHLPLRPTGALGDKLSIEHLAIHDGQIRLTDETGLLLFGGAALGLEGGLSASGLRLDGTLVQAGERVGLRLSLNAQDDAVRLKLLAERTTSGISLDYDGVVNLAAGRPVIAGNMSLMQQPMRLQAKVSGDDGRLQLDEIDLRLGGEAGLKLGGTAELLPRAGRLTAQLGAKGVDLDKLMASPVQGIVDLAPVAGVLAGLPGGTDVKLELTDLLFNETPVVRLAASLLGKDGVWQVPALTARLPGQGALSLEGGRFDVGTPTLSGAVRLVVGDSAGFGRWLLRGGAPMVLAGAGGFELSGQLRAEASQLSLKDLALKLAGGSVEGELGIGATGLDGRLKLNGFDLGNPFESGQASALLSRLPVQGQVVLAAHRLRLLDIDLDAVDGTLTWRGGKLAIADMRIDGGEELAANLTGAVDTQAVGGGQFDGQLRVGSTLLPRLARLAGLPSTLAQALQVMAPLDLTGTIKAEQSGAVRVQTYGTLAGGPLIASGRFSLTDGSGGLQLKLEHDGKVLGRWLGLEDTGAGQLTLEAVRSPVGWRVEQARLGAGTATVQVQADGVDGLKVSLTQLRVPEWACPLPVGAPLTGEFRFALQPDGWQARQLVLSAADNMLVGALTRQDGEIGGNLEISRLDAARLGKCLKAPWSQAPLSLKLRVGKLALSEQLTAELVELMVRRDGLTSEIGIDAGQLAGGALSGAFDLVTGQTGLAVNARLKLDQAEAGSLLTPWVGAIDGKLSVNLRLQAEGGDAEALRRSLSGDGTLRLTGATIRGISDDVFAVIGGELADRMSVDVDLGRLVAGNFDAGSVRLEELQVPLVITGGMARVSARLPVSASGVQMAFSGQFDLVNQRVEARAILTGADVDEIGVPPQITLRIAGVIGASERNIETSAFSAWLALRQAKRELERVEKARVAPAIKSPPKAATGAKPRSTSTLEERKPKVLPLEAPITIGPASRPVEEPLKILPQ